MQSLLHLLGKALQRGFRQIEKGGRAGCRVGTNMLLPAEAMDYALHDYVLSAIEPTNDHAIFLDESLFVRSQFVVVGGLFRLVVKGRVPGADAIVALECC